MKASVNETELTNQSNQTQNKAQLLAVCGHVSASNQSLCFILSLRMNSSFITSGPGHVRKNSLLLLDACITHFTFGF